jgi:hypothetical protein
MISLSHRHFHRTARWPTSTQAYLSIQTAVRFSSLSSLDRPALRARSRSRRMRFPSQQRCVAMLQHTKRALALAASEARAALVCCPQKSARTCHGCAHVASHIVQISFFCAGKHVRKRPLLRCSGASIDIEMPAPSDACGVCSYSCRAATSWLLRCTASTVAPNVATDLAHALQPQSKVEGHEKFEQGERQHVPVRNARLPAAMRSLPRDVSCSGARSVSMTTPLSLITGSTPAHATKR